MDVNIKMEINQLVNDLTEGDSDRYPTDAAARLIDLMNEFMPAVTHSGKYYMFSLRGGNSTNVSGYSPGVGEVSVKDSDEEAKSRTFGEPASQRFGGYKLQHSMARRSKIAHISISQMWASTFPDQTGRHCDLKYKVEGKVPMELRLSFQKTTSILIPSFFGLTRPVRLNYANLEFKPWKLPDCAPVEAKPEDYS